jgi:hypothetical protein
LLLIAVIIVAAVGIYYLAQGVLVLATDFEIPAEIEDIVDEFPEIVDVIKSLTAGIMIFLGLLTLVFAILLFSGSTIGRIMVTILLAVASLFNILGAVTGDIYSIIELILAAVVLVLLYQPAVNEYFTQPRNSGPPQSPPPYY